MDPHAARALGIAAIYQQPALFPHLTVAENIALALESPSVWRRVDWKRAGAARANCSTASARESIRSGLVDTLSMPEQQIVEIAKAIGADASVVIMDEPTASLTEREVERLFGVIARLRGAGRRHHLHLAPPRGSVRDRRSHHRAARRRDASAHARSNAIDRPELIRLMVGRELSTVFPKREVTLGDDRAGGTRAVDIWRAGIHDVSLSVRRGEILGLAGLVGSGRTELAETLFGLTPADAGEIWSMAQPCASARRPRRSRLASATCRRIAASTASCSRCRSRRTRAWRTCGVARARPDRPRQRSARRAQRYRRAAAHQDALGRRAEVGLAVGRQPAEGRAGALAVDQARGPDPRRADAGRGRRLEGGDPRADAGRWPSAASRS